MLDIKQCYNNTSKNPSKFKIQDNLLYYEKRLYIPKELARLCILQAYHDFPTAGHFRFNKTLELISWNFWWPQMWKTIKNSISSCNICFRSKNPQHCLYELFQLLVLKQPWSSISMDFITNLLTSNFLILSLLWLINF